MGLFTREKRVYRFQEHGNRGNPRDVNHTTTHGTIYVLAHMKTDEKGIYFSYLVEFHSGVAASHTVASLYKKVQ
jgi:hypothetical protein